MQKIINYIKEVFNALKTLFTGMKITGYYFVHARKEIITQQYPENREELKMFERFRGEVIMPHNEDNEHRCTGCTACEVACPNGTIEIISDRKENEEGKKKKVLDQFVYHLQMCTMCGLCIPACPTDAIKMGPGFEHAVFDRADLTKILNEPGSKLMKGVED